MAASARLPYSTLPLFTALNCTLLYGTVRTLHLPTISIIKPVVYICKYGVPRLFIDAVHYKCTNTSSYTKVCTLSNDMLPNKPKSNKQTNKQKVMVCKQEDVKKSNLSFLGQTNSTVISLYCCTFTYQSSTLCCTLSLLRTLTCSNDVSTHGVVIGNG